MAATLNKNTDFVVGEEKALNYVMATLLFALFAYGVYDAARRGFKNIDYQSFIFALAIFPAIYCIRRAMANRIYIRINKTGIYEGKKMVTGWADLVKVYLAQDPDKPMYDIRDRFQLVVEFKKEGKGLRRRIPLTNTQNKSEEDVLAAANFFWKEFKKDNASFITTKK